jgi:hypothetical protein
MKLTSEENSDLRIALFSLALPLFPFAGFVALVFFLAAPANASESVKFTLPSVSATVGSPSAPPYDAYAKAAGSNSELVALDKHLAELATELAALQQKRNLLQIHLLAEDKAMAALRQRIELADHPTPAKKP